MLQTVTFNWLLSYLSLSAYTGYYHQVFFWSMSCT